VNETQAQVEAQLRQLIDTPGVDAPEVERRRGLLQLYMESPGRNPVEFTALSMQKRR
jgi:hypothetical protein